MAFLSLLLRFFLLLILLAHSFGEAEAVAIFRQNKVDFQETCFSTFGKIPNARPIPNERKFRSEAIEEIIANISSAMFDKDLAMLFSNCLPNTLDTTVEFTAFNSSSFDTFIITGDILSMWLRDSTNQVLPYVQFADRDEHLANMIEGLINRQIDNVLYDSYANAFNKENEGTTFMNDNTLKKGFLGTDVSAMTFHLHERKYELDSLCSVIQLSVEFFKVTNLLRPFQQEKWKNAIKTIITVIKEQQRGSDEGNDYFFQRTTNRPLDTLLWGVGPPAMRTGMSKSPFRPSDDASTLPFPIAANAMAVVNLRNLSSLLIALNETEMVSEALELSNEILKGIQMFGIRDHPKYGSIYAYPLPMTNLIIADID